ncbi:sensor histidine kinase YycG [bacterium BMS3Abin01]|nr:sensor histidine kinase YycG [bacterium BMS3Abin01]
MSSSSSDKIRLGIAFKLSLVFFSVFLLAAGIIYVYVVPQLQSRLTDQKLDNMKSYATLYSESFLTAYSQGASPVYLDLLTQQYAERADARILLMDVSGNLISDSLKGQAFSADDYPVARKAIERRQPEVDVHTVDDRNYGMAAVPLGNGNTVVQVVVVSSAMDDVESAVTLVQRQLTVAAAVALLIALAVIYAFSHIFTRRIKRIESGARRIARGDFDTKVPIQANDELGELAAAFNDMGNRLGSAFRQIDLEQQRAKLLLDDLSEGVIGVDADGNVIVANPAAEALLGGKIEPPAPLMECVPEEIYSLWHSMASDSPAREDTFVLPGERALMVHVSSLTDQAELATLLVIRDVSQEVKLEQARRDFIANASHEFKTPIFSLSGFLEILEDEDVDEKTRTEFMATMREQVDRLASLARNLLDLSQMDSGVVSIETAPFHLREVVDAVAREFQAVPGFAHHPIETGGLPADLVAHGDRERTAQLVRILVDNALKYSPEGSTVMVAGTANDTTVSFTVADQGSGIPERELSRVFERFYRGKSAGRIRGTGLGLSIAHELARLMNGDIQVRSTSRGTSITVTLPANGTPGA